IPLLSSVSQGEPETWDENATLATVGLPVPALAPDGAMLLGPEQIDAGRTAALSPNAVVVLERRYLKKDDAGRPIELPDAMFARVARAVAAPDASHHGDPSASERTFFQMMRALEFLPNSPTLMNAGRDLGQLSACFTLPVDDSIPAIFDAVK